MRRTFFFRAGHDGFGIAIGYSLFVDIETSAEIGVEKHCLAIERPSSGPIDAIVESEPLWSLQRISAVLQFGNIDIALRLVIEEDETLAIRGQFRIVEEEAGPIGEAPWISFGLAGFRIEAQLPKIGIVLVGRRLAQRINKTSVLAPTLIAQPRIGKHNDWDRRLASCGFPARLSLRHSRSKVSHRRFACRWPAMSGKKICMPGFVLHPFFGIAAVGIHHPDAVLDRIAEDNFRSIMRERCVVGIVAQFFQRGADHGDHPDALLLLGHRAADQQFGPILGPFDARSTKAESIRDGKRLRFAGTEQSEVKSFEIGVEKIFSIRRNGGDCNWIFRGVGGELLRF